MPLFPAWAKRGDFGLEHGRCRIDDSTRQPNERQGLGDDGVLVVGPAAHDHGRLWRRRGQGGANGGELRRPALWLPGCETTKAVFWAGAADAGELAQNNTGAIEAPTTVSIASRRFPAMLVPFRVKRHDLLLHCHFGEVSRQTSDAQEKP